MSNTVIYELMNSLISKRYYSTKDEAMYKLGVYFAFYMIDNAQMQELALLAEGVYAPPVEPEPDVPMEPEIPAE